MAIVMMSGQELFFLANCEHHGDIIFQLPLKPEQKVPNRNISHVTLVYVFIAEQSSKEPEWNFYKYLVGPDGVVINAWGTKDEIEEIFAEIQEAAEKAKKDAEASSKTASKETVPEQPEELKVEL